MAWTRLYFERLQRLEQDVPACGRLLNRTLLRRHDLPRQDSQSRPDAPQKVPDQPDAEVGVAGGEAV